MQIKPGEIGRVFSLTENKEIINCRMGTISTYEGRDKKGVAIYNYWRIHFLGDAYYKSMLLSNKEDIVLTSAKVNKVYDTKREQLYIHISCYDFERRKR